MHTPDGHAEGTRHKVLATWQVTRGPLCSGPPTQAPSQGLAYTSALSFPHETEIRRPPLSTGPAESSGQLSLAHRLVSLPLAGAAAPRPPTAQLLSTCRGPAGFRCLKSLSHRICRASPGGRASIYEGESGAHVASSRKASQGGGRVEPWAAPERWPRPAVPHRLSRARAQEPGSGHRPSRHRSPPALTVPPASSRTLSRFLGKVLRVGQGGD